MKYLPILLLLGVSIASCSSKDEGASVIPATDRVDTTAVVETKGVFVSAPGESVEGNAKIVTSGSTSSLALENMKVHNGPDLHVYLSADLQAKNFIDLGKLKSISGTQVYVINGTVNFNTYKYALIHCQQYNVLFGSALLN